MYTRGLWDMGDTFSATEVQHGDARGVPCTIWGWRRWGCRIGTLQSGKEGTWEGCGATTQPGRCHPTVVTTLSPPQQTLTGRDCSRGCHCSPSVEREPVNGEAGDKGQPRCHHQEQEPGGLEASPTPNPSSWGVSVPAHQVKVTVVAEVVAQRVLGDVVALAAHQLPVHLGEERWGKDTCVDGGTWHGHPHWWDPLTPKLGGHPSPQLTSHREEEQC